MATRTCTGAHPCTGEALMSLAHRRTSLHRQRAQARRSCRSRTGAHGSHTRAHLDTHSYHGRHGIHLGGHVYIFWRHMRCDTLSPTGAVGAGWRQSVDDEMRHLVADKSASSRPPRLCICNRVSLHTYVEFRVLTDTDRPPSRSTSVTSVEFRTLTRCSGTRVSGTDCAVHVGYIT